MNEIAKQISDIVSDYRHDEAIELTPNKILEWATQFEVADRIFVLEETKAILQKRYVSKAWTERFLKSAVEDLSKRYGYDSVTSFLRDTDFLDLQEEGKSQKALLALLDAVLQKHWAISLKECGSHARKFFFYLDDILCTGNTVYWDLVNWLEQETNGKTRLTLLNEAGAKVVLLYIFTHAYNRRKLQGRLWHRQPNFSYQVLYALNIENDFENASSSLDFAFPFKKDQPQIVLDYFAELGVPEHGVFRPEGRPETEGFFSSPENRVRYENILLRKGLEILESVKNKKDNIRPLGYTLPSHKNFGFGTFCFTWRNVPNNTPLVFWYDSPMWSSLFDKKQVGTTFDMKELDEILRKLGGLN